MVIKKIVLSIMHTNCYFIINNGDCIVIDPASDADKILDFAKNNNVNIKAILLTHGHFDHVGACKELQKHGIKTYISKIENKNLKENPKLLGLRPSMSFDADYELFDGEELDLIGLKIKCLLTSGHTDGSMCFLVDDNLFCGDTIFAGGNYGRCDLFSGNFDSIQDSIKNIIFKLADNTKLLPGHGEGSFVQNEKQYYPAFK